MARSYDWQRYHVTIWAHIYVSRVTECHRPSVSVSRSTSIVSIISNWNATCGGGILGKTAWELVAVDVSVKSRWEKLVGRLLCRQYEDVVVCICGGGIRGRVKVQENVTMARVFVPIHFSLHPFLQLCILNPYGLCHIYFVVPTLWYIQHGRWATRYFVYINKC